MSLSSRIFFRSLCIASSVCIFNTLNLNLVAFNYHLSSSAVAQEFNEQSYDTQDQVQLFRQGMDSQVRFAFSYSIKDNFATLDRHVLAQTIATLLVDYPDAYDYWEIVNLSITQDLLAMYPQLDHITLDLEMMPREVIPHYCVSTVTRWRDGRVEESWAFEVRDIVVKNHGLNAYVNYTYREGAHYPDFLTARTLLLDYLQVLQVSELSLQEIEESLAQHILESYSRDVSSVGIRLR